MSKTYRPWKIDQPLLLPVTVQDFVGEVHLARFVVELVVAPHREGVARARRLHEHRLARRAGLPDGFRLPQAPSEGAAGAFRSGSEALRAGGLVKLGHIALDGTKIKANASRHKAMSYARMEERAAELEAEVARWIGAAAAADAAEDRAFGGDKSGEEMPAWVADKKKRA